MVTFYNDTAWGLLEENLLPTAAKGIDYPITLIKQACAVAVLVPATIFTSTLKTFERIHHYASNLFYKPILELGFKPVLQDSRLWEKIDVQSELKKDPIQCALVGTASCTYQDSGYESCPNSQWADWEKKTIPFANQSLESRDLFTSYQEGLDDFIIKLKVLGVNSYRTSIEWSHIEPALGDFDEKKLNVYFNLCKKLKESGIEPMITLHHFSEPKWFHDSGSFANSKNTEHFVNFSTKVAEKLRSAGVTYFCTINEPSIEAFSRYVRGAYSPGHFMDFEGAGKFLQGALRAHMAVYKALKNEHGEKIQIGFTHQYLKFIPGSLLVTPATRYLTKLINDTVLNFLKTGAFSLQVPLFCNQFEKIAEAEEKKGDFVGVQFYTRPIISLRGSVSSHNNEAMTAMPFREDPAGLYEAIVDTHQASGLPIIVTENGISTHDETQRERYMQRAFYAFKEAQKVLHENLKGYFQWCLVDNFEWDLGMKPQAFGAYSDMQSAPKLGVSGLKDFFSFKM